MGVLDFHFKNSSGGRGHPPKAPPKPKLLIETLHLIGCKPLFYR